MEKTRKYIFAVLLFLACFSVYSGLIFGKLRTGPVELNYFKDLALAFTQGRLDIENCPQGTNCDDMVSYKDKHYLYQPPVPALIYMPLVKIFGRQSPDALVNAFFGSLNCVLVFFVLMLAGKRLGYDFGLNWYFMLSVFWAFGTVHFYISMLGSVWHQAQVFGQVFLLLSLLFLLLGDSVLCVLLSGLFFAMAVFTKNDLVFYGVFIAALAMTRSFRQRGLSGGKPPLYRSRTNFGQRAIVFMAPLVLAGCAMLAYNAARFDGNMLETGIKYHGMNPVFADNYNKHGYLSFFYAPYNFFTEVLMPPKCISAFPFFEYDPKGFGFLWASPLFALSFASIALLFRKETAGPGSNDRGLIAAGFISLFLVMGLIMTIMGNGWSQFASRYSLDYQLLMLILLLPVIGKWQKALGFKAVFMVLLAMAVYMNTNGVIYFNY